MRIFVAVPLPGDIRTALSGLCGGIAGTRWIEPDNMHITLRFAGEISRAEAEDLHLELATIRFPEFEIGLSGIGTFERRGHVHMLWVGFEFAQTLIELRDRVEAAAVRSGLSPNPRKFKPHITLCRFKSYSMPDIGPYLEMNNAFSTPPFLVDRFTLYQSRLGHGGARYEVLHEYPLTQTVLYGEEAVGSFIN